MRKLKTCDIPAFCRCLKAIGIKEQVQTISKEAADIEEVWDKGFDLLWSIFDAATESDGEKHFYAFLAAPFEMTAEEVADMDISEFFDSTKKLVEENDLVTFFKSAGALMKSQ